MYERYIVTLGVNVLLRECLLNSFKGSRNLRDINPFNIMQSVLRIYLHLTFLMRGGDSNRAEQRTVEKIV